MASLHLGLSYCTQYQVRDHKRAKEVVTEGLDLLIDIITEGKKTAFSGLK